MLQGCTVGILGVYMHFHSSAELTCPWMSSSTQETARLWMPPPHEEEHAVHGVASHLQKQGESSGQTHTLPTPSVSFPTTPSPVSIRAIGFWEAELQRTESQWLPRSAESERIQCWQKCPVNIEALHKCKKLLWELCTRLSVGSITYSKEGCSVLFLIVSIYILSVSVFVWVYVYIGIIFILFYIL